MRVRPTTAAPHADRPPLVRRRHVDLQRLSGALCPARAR